MKKIILIFLFFAILSFVMPVFAADQPDCSKPGADCYGLNATAGQAGLQTTDSPDALPEIVGRFINWGLGILGTFFIVIVLVGGYIWMMAAGNEEKVHKAKMMIGTAISGLFIVFISYALSLAIVNALIEASK